jgi:molybdate transport system regulatory protein
MIASKPRTAELVLRVKLGDGILGPGKIELLERIDRLGSISAAARDMKMSYRQAWMLVETINEKFREPLVRTAQGGQRGGGTTLTPAGRKLVRCYRSMLARIAKLVASELETIVEMTGR